MLKKSIVSMRNPWLYLPRVAPFVLPEDRDAIMDFNGRAREHHAIHLEIVPEPYLGNPDAPVVLLNLNPGFVESDMKVHLDREFNEAAVANLEHRYPAYPFYLLDPRFPSPGQDWWRRKLRALIGEVGLQAVASGVFVVEIHGYHSRRYSPVFQVPSQEYSRYLVREAMARGGHFVVMRGWREWLRLLPELREARTVSFLRNVQNPVISRGNCPDGYDALVESISRSG